MKFLIVFVAIWGVLQALPSQYGLTEFDKNFSNEFEEEEIQECHGIRCPFGTVACSKTVKSSTDRKILLTTIQCENIDGQVLNSATKETENPFEGTHVQSFSFTGHYNFSPGTNRKPTLTTSYNNNPDKNVNYDLVETFAK